MELRDIQGGAMPADVLREYLKENPESTRIQVALKFVGAFPEVDGAIHQIIWSWKRLRSRGDGLSDEELNEQLLRCLRDAGYLK